MVMRVLSVLLPLFSGGVGVTLPTRHIRTTEDAVIWAYIGNETEAVGNLHAGQIIAVEPDTKDYYIFNFGSGEDYTDRGHLEPVQGCQRMESGLGDLNKPSSSQSLIIWKDTPVYNAPDVDSVPFGTLVEDLRYPMFSRLKDRLNQTWYQIRIGEQLAYINILDAQQDNDIPTLAYRHILRDEKNIRFCYTFTTASVCVFNNQMTWL